MTPHRCPERVSTTLHPALSAAAKASSTSFFGCRGLAMLTRYNCHRAGVNCPRAPSQRAPVRAVRRSAALKIESLHEPPDSCSRIEAAHPSGTAQSDGGVHDGVRRRPEKTRWLTLPGSFGRRHRLRGRLAFVGLRLFGHRHRDVRHGVRVLTGWRVAAPARGVDPAMRGFTGGGPTTGERPMIGDQVSSDTHTLRPMAESASSMRFMLDARPGSRSRRT